MTQTAPGSLLQS